MPNFSVIVIPMLHDHYSYYIHPTDDIQKGCFVDVIEPSKVEKFRKDFNITSPVSNALATHIHPDFHDANKQLTEVYPELVVMAGQADAVPGCTRPINDGDTFDMFDGQINVTCFHVPCHTKGSILYYLKVDNCVDGDMTRSIMKNEYKIVSNINKCVFTGDTILIAGCGRFAEADAAGMVKAMDVMLSLPDDTKIFCGHEYTKTNFEFCIKSEGGLNKKIEEHWEKYEEMLKNGGYSVPSILKDEKQYNVFMRCRTDDL